MAAATDPQALAEESLAIAPTPPSPPAVPAAATPVATPVAANPVAATSVVAIPAAAVSNASETATSSAAPPAATADPAAATLVRPAIELRIAGVQPGKGQVKVAVFTGPGDFPQPSAAEATLQLSPTADELTAEIDWQVQVAVAAYQDLDGDGVLTTNRFGIPLEPYGFSNAAVNRRGPPTFEQAAVRFQAAVSHPAPSLTIQLQ